MNNNFTFLTEDQIFGNNQLEILKNYGSKCVITDFSILLGGSTFCNYNADKIKSEGRNGLWWTKTPIDHNQVKYIDLFGNVGKNVIYERSIGARPSITYSKIANLATTVRKDNGIKEIEYGEYPQTIVDENYAYELEKAYNKYNMNEEMTQTGKVYTTDSVNSDDFTGYFKPKEYIEYEYKNKKYIRFETDLNCENKILTEDKKINVFQPYWICVEPITWIVDEKADIALSKKIIFAGIQFQNCNLRDYKANFNESDIKQFMNKYFSQEILKDKVYSAEKSKPQGKVLRVKKHSHS